MANEVVIIETRATQLAEKIEVLVTEARKKVASVVNTAQVYTYLSKIPDTVLEIENKEIYERLALSRDKDEENYLNGLRNLERRMRYERVEK